MSVKTIIFMDHVQKMKNEKIWATSCAIFAAAYMLQMEIFMLSQPDSDYKWLFCAPPGSAPPSTEYMLSGTDPFCHCHISLLHRDACHYDRIMVQDGGCNCETPKPSLDGIKESINLCKPQVELIYPATYTKQNDNVFLWVLLISSLH